MPQPLDEEQDDLAVMVVLIILSATLISLIWYLFGTYDSEVLSTIIDASVSIVLTGIVAAIYYRQWRTEREQAEIEREQKEIADAMKEFQSQPALDVVDKNPIATGWKLYMGNFGFGPAHDLTLVVNIDTEDTNHVTLPTSVKLEKKIDGQGDDQVSTNAILPKSEVETFLAEDIDIDLEDSDQTSFRSLFEEIAIHDDDEAVVTIDLTVHAQDAFGEKYTADAGKYTIPVGELSKASDYKVNTVLSFEEN